MNAVSSLRYPTALTAALLLTSSLFFTLNALTDREITVVPITTTKIDFSRQKEDTVTQDKRVIEKPERVIEKPILPPKVGRGEDEKRLPTDITLVTPPTTVPVGPDTSGFGSDTEATPVLRVNPIYPDRLAAREIEGWVRVRFNISVTGTVLDAIVVDGEPMGAFDDAALDAIKRWRYNPKVENGAAVERRGVETMLRFTLE